jgi:hypothetical protein
MADFYNVNIFPFNSLCEEKTYAVKILKRNFCIIQDTSDTSSSIQLLASSISNVFSIANEVNQIN